MLISSFTITLALVLGVLLAGMVTGRGMEGATEYIKYVGLGLFGLLAFLFATAAGAMGYRWMKHLNGTPKTTQNLRFLAKNTRTLYTALLLAAAAAIVALEAL